MLKPVLHLSDGRAGKFQVLMRKIRQALQGPEKPPLQSYGGKQADEMDPII
jgi:hypothetical protein